MRIVVVEDETPIREGISKILKKIDESYELAGKARNGKEGLEVIEREKPELIIMDIKMPDMDGLTMLKILRERKVQVKALVLTAYSDFNYAKQAIELGIENYLLKPVTVPELKKVLKQIEANLEEEKRRDQHYQLPVIFQNAVLGELYMDNALEEVVNEKYGFSLKAPLYLFGVWMGNAFDKEKEDAKSMLRGVEAHAKKFSLEVIEVRSKELLLVIVYRCLNADEVKGHFERAVHPMLFSNLVQKPVCIWGKSNSVQELESAVKCMWEQREWNLVFQERTLLSDEKIQKLEVIPLKYPLELETQVRQAIVKKDKKEFERCFIQFRQLCRQYPHQPKDIKEACIRYCFAVMNTAKEYDSLTEDFSAQKLLRVIAEAATWEEIASVLDIFFQGILIDKKSESIQKTSAMVQRAKAMIQEYYNQGITLEEIAGKMGVSEEYLSTQFKKEAGVSFTETIRKVRIDKIKQLLIESNLKLTQIADMVGYADPKYMSKVFKEEVGMLPGEYRKLNK